MHHRLLELARRLDDLDMKRVVAKSKSQRAKGIVVLVPTIAGASGSGTHPPRAYLISSHYASGKSIFISLCTTEMGETAEMNKLQMKTLMLEIECWRQLAHQAKICLEPKQTQLGSH